MKHYFKKMMALVIAAIMVMGTMVTVMATDADPTPTSLPGSITVKRSETVSLTNKTLKAYRILDATYGSTGTLGGDPAQAVAYTIPAKMINFYNDYFAEKANGVIAQDAQGNAKTASYLAAAAGKTVDQFVAEKIAALTTAELKDFEYAALAAAKAANVTADTGALSNGDYVFTGLEAGYYVIEDEGAGVPISALMLDTVTDADVEIQLKAEDKTQKEIMTAGELVNNKANELGLGRAVNYKITQEIPDYIGYDYYYYMINDTLSSGLTFNPDTVVVNIIKPATEAEYAPQSAYATDEAAAADGYETNPGGTNDKFWIKPAQPQHKVELAEGTDYYLYYDNGAESDDAGYAANEVTKNILGGKTFIIAFADIVSNNTIVIGDDVEITYSATVNSDAVVGVDPNTNMVNVQYSNNPDKDSRGDYDSDHPGIPLNDGNHPTGVGPDKFTDTYTTKLQIKKVDGNNDALEGVEFTLTGTAKDAVFNTEEVFEIDPAGTYWLLKDGTYTTTAPTNEPSVSETTGGAGWVEMEANETPAAGVPVRVVGNKKYRPYVESTDSEKTRYVIVEGNEADYASTTIKYKKETKAIADPYSEAEGYKVERTGVTAMSGNDAVIDFSQLGAGTYKLSETGILAGYNGIQDIEFTITCTLPNAANVVAGTEKAGWAITTNTPNVSFVEETETVEDPDTHETSEVGLGTYVITIQNNQGAELPSTGGIGTTIFYVVGAILVIGAGLILITRRRMSVQ